MRKPFVGQIVHFVQSGVHYAAMVVKVWSDSCVNLQVFPNGSDVITPGATDSNDRAYSVTYSGPCSTCGSGPREWSWHFVENPDADGAAA